MATILCSTTAFCASVKPSAVSYTFVEIKYDKKSQSEC